MKSAFVFLCILVITLSEESSAPPRKRQIYLINTPHLDWNKPESSNNAAVCQDDDSSISTNYFASRLKSFKHKGQRLVFEIVVATSFYRASLGLLTSNTSTFSIPQNLRTLNNPESSTTPPPHSPQPQPTSSSASSSLFNQLYSHGQNPDGYLNEREIYLINAGNLKVNEAKSAKNLECKTDETLAYANYIVTRLKSINDKRQRLLCEQLIVSALHKTLLQSETLVNTVTRQQTTPSSLPQQQPQPQPQSPPADPVLVGSAPETQTNQSTIRNPSQPSVQEPIISTATLNQPPRQSQSRIKTRPLLTFGGGTSSEGQAPLGGAAPVGAGTAYIETAPVGAVGITTPSTTSLPTTPSSTTALSTTLETAPATANDGSSSMALVSRDIPAEERQKLQEIHAECQVDPLSKVDEVLIRALDANKDNRQVQIHMYCIGVKSGMIRPDGIVNERIIKRKIGLLIEGEEAINEVYRKCNIAKNSKEATITYFWVCLMSEGTEYYPKV